MYRRYSQTNGNGVSLSQLKRSRLKDVLIVLLAGLLIAALVFAVNLWQKQNGLHTQYVQRVLSECDEAIRQTAELSGNGAADSASILARIRSNMYAIRTVSSLSNAQGSGSLVNEDRILTLQNTVDQYLTYLTTGMDTTQYRMNLQNALEELREELGRLN